jgi:hypothetical protein
MSTELKSMKQTGSCSVELLLTRYYGGSKHGTCLQLTSPNGYVQLNTKDMERLIQVWQKEIGALKIKERRKTVKASTPVQQLKQAISFASKWCEKEGWSPDCVDDFAKALELYRKRACV